MPEHDRRDADVLPGDSGNFFRYDRVPDEEQFVRELREDILPFIVQNYSTYAADGAPRRSAPRATTSPTRVFRWARSTPITP